MPHEDALPPIVAKLLQSAWHLVRCTIAISSVLLFGPLFVQLCLIAITLLILIAFYAAILLAAVFVKTVYAIAALLLLVVVAIAFGVQGLRLFVYAAVLRYD